MTTAITLTREAILADRIEVVAGTLRRSVMSGLPPPPSVVASGPCTARA
jgi:hypothetical protein